MVREFQSEVFPRNIVTINSDSSDITFTGLWDDVSDREAWGTLYKRTTTLGDKISFTFTGTAILGRFQINSSSSTSHRYRVDGGSWRTLNLYSETTDYAFIVLAYNLTKTSHTIEIENMEAGKALCFDVFRYETESGALQVDTMIEARISAKVEMDKGLGRTDWLPVVEQAPATGVYFATPTDIADGDYTSLLMDLKRRVYTRTLGQYLVTPPTLADADLHELLLDAGARTVTRPKGSELLDFRQKTTTGELITESFPQTGTLWDVSDRAARLLGKVYGDQGVVIKQKVTTGELLSGLLDTAGAQINPAKEDGNLASIKTNTDTMITSLQIIDDQNLAKWGGAALTGRDISGDLSKLDVALSTKARLQPWYQTNFTTDNKRYGSGSVAPHALTNRWTYTVPADRIARIMGSYCMLMRDSAPTSASYAVSAILVASAVYLPYLVEITSATYVPRLMGYSESAIVRAGETIVGQTADVSVGGTYSYEVDVNIMVFDT